MNKPIATTLESAFFSLLRAGLWPNQLPDISLFDENTNWEMLFVNANRQAMLGIVWDGIVKLPTHLQPPRKIKFNWYSLVLKIEQTNQQINEAAVEIIQLYKQHGLNPILLKGAGVATLYPNPLHRGCGDIDIYIGRADCEKANQLAASIGFVMDKDSEQHAGMKRGFITLENHREMITPFMPCMKRMFGEQLNGWYPNSSGTVVINGVDIPVAPLEFNTRYVFFHLYKHFTMSGVGLRQLCDWALMLDRANLTEVDVQDCMNGWQFLGLFLVDYLGLDAAKMPYYNPNKKDKMLKAKDIIMEEGNFGFERLNHFSKRPDSYWAGKFHSFRFQSVRWMKLFSLQPCVILSYVFIYHTVASVKVLLQGK